MRTKIILGAVLFSMGLGSPAFAQSSAPSKKAAGSEDEMLVLARALVKEADELHKQGGCAVSYSRYLLGYKAAPILDIAASLGACEVELGKYVEGATHLSQFLRESPPERLPEDRQRATESLERAKSKVLTLAIRPESAGVSVYLDGLSLGIAPIAEEVFVEPGTHTVRAVLGNMEGEVEVSGEAGGRKVVKVPLAVRQPPKVVEPTPNWHYILAGGLSAIGLAGTSIAFSQIADSRSTDRWGLTNSLHASCPGNTDDQKVICANVQTAVEKLKTQEHTWIYGTGIMAGLAIAAAVFPIAYVYWPRGKGEKGAGAKLTVTAELSPQRAGVFVVGSF